MTIRRMKAFRIFFFICFAKQNGAGQGIKSEYFNAVSYSEDFLFLVDE